MRTTKAERKKNARQFYEIFRRGYENRACIVVERGNNGKCRFLTALSQIQGAPVVIAESILGVEGCFMELFGNFYSGTQKGYYEDDFKEWVKETFGIEIAYFDGLVFILERE